MNCEAVADKISVLASRSLAENERLACMDHVASCSDCSDALRGAEALFELQGRDVAATPSGLFEKVMAKITDAPAERGSSHRFWLGAGFGGAVAASLFAAAFALGWFGNIKTNVPEMAEFVVALNETREMAIAIETDQALPGAIITILLSGAVELDGFAGRRELTWTEDLEAGINRLRLPVFAMGEGGGQLIVRLTHPLSEQVFIIRLRTDT